MPVQGPRQWWFLQQVSRNDMPVWLHSWIHVCVPAVSGKGNLHVECNGPFSREHTAPLPNAMALFLESTQLRYQTHFFRPGQRHSLLALAVFFMPLLTSNIGYANCTVSHCSLVDVRCTSGCRCKEQCSTIPQWHVSCGVRIHAQLPTADLKFTPLTTRAN